MSEELSRPPEQTAATVEPAEPPAVEESGDAVEAKAATESEPEPRIEAVAEAGDGAKAAAAEPALEAGAGAEIEPEAEAQAQAEAEAEAQRGGLPKGSIAAVGERLGQRVAQVSEAAGDKVAHAGEAVAHAGEVAAARVAQVGGVAAERVAHAGEAAGQRVILAGEAAEGTVADAQTRAAQAKQRLSRQAGELVSRVRHSTPPPVREKGARAVDAVKKHPRETAVGSAIVGLVAMIRRRAKRSGTSH